MISGSNVLVLCLSIFLINSGQSWVAARTGWTGWDVGRLHLSSGRKFVLFGLLRDKDGNVIGKATQMCLNACHHCSYIYIYDIYIYNQQIRLLHNLHNSFSWARGVGNQPHTRAGRPSPDRHQTETGDPRPTRPSRGPDSPHYANLGIGETIGGPFEDTTGPAGEARPCGPRIRTCGGQSWEGNLKSDTSCWMAKTGPKWSKRYVLGLLVEAFSMDPLLGFLAMFLGVSK